MVEILKFIIRRFLLLIPILFGGTFLIFMLVYAIPGDPIAALAGNRPVPPSVAETLRQKYHLDDPLLIRYCKYIWALLHGDFGANFAGRSVISIVAKRFPITLQLGLVAILIESFVGIIAGVLAALKKGSFLDNIISISTIILASIPVFVIGFILQFLFGIKMVLFPISGLQQGALNFVLPGITLAAVSLAYVARLTKSEMESVLQADYIRTATAKGVSRFRVIFLHGLRNSLIPVVTFIGADLGVLLAGTVFTETVFNIPGLGRAAYEAVRNQEGTVVVGIVTLTIIVYVITNLFVDILYALLDPRIRYE